MPDPLPLNDKNTQRLFEIVEALQQRHGLDVEAAELKQYPAWLRSGFPRRLVHVGLERWGVVEME